MNVNLGLGKENYVFWSWGEVLKIDNKYPHCEDLITGSLVRLHGVHLTLSHHLNRVEGWWVARCWRDDSLKYGHSVVRLCPCTRRLDALAAPLLLPWPAGVLCLFLAVWLHTERHWAEDWAPREKEVPTLDVVAPDWGIIVNTMSGRRRRHPATAYTHRAYRPVSTSHIRSGGGRGV